MTPKTLNDLRDLAFENSTSKGFHDAPKSVGDDIALMHSELSEALEDSRAGHPPWAFWYEKKSVEGHPLTYASQDYSQEGIPLRKPCGIPSEMADVIIRVLDFCGKFDIDIEQAVTEKMAYNATRPHMHGGKKL